MHVSLGAAILILGLIYFAVVSPGFRKALLWTIGLAVLGVVAIILHLQSEINPFRSWTEASYCDSVNRRM